MVKTWHPVNALNCLAFLSTINWPSINISPRYAHECLDKSMPWLEYLSSCRKTASGRCSTHSYCQIFCIVPLCGTSVQITIRTKWKKVQKRALRLVLNDYTSSYLELLEKVNRPPLYVSRIETNATEIFKCLTDISPNFVKNIFTIGDQPYDLRGGSRIIQPMVNSKTFGLKTFGYEGARMWNKLPEALKNATGVNVSKITSTTGQD